MIGGKMKLSDLCENNESASIHIFEIPEVEEKKELGEYSEK